MGTVSGHTQGLKTHQKQALQALVGYHFSPDQWADPFLLEELARISGDTGRQVGVLVTRQGYVDEVFVGTSQRIFLPDIGRQRGGQKKLRGIRHIRTHLGKPLLLPEDITDLMKLFLDAVMVVGVGEGGVWQGLSCGYRDVSSPLDNYDIVEKLPEDSFLACVKSIEQGLAKNQVAVRVQGAVRAVLSGVYSSQEEAVWRIEELKELTATAGVQAVDVLPQIRRQVDGKYVLGKGKLDEIVLRALDQDAELLILDHDLTPAQARAVASATSLKVLDRTQLILDIFAQHAQSKEGKLQVELAQLKYRLPRLTDLDAGLSRLTGGIGGRGPGETKLEINRRRARDRITRLEREIERLSSQRYVRRQKRDKGQCPVVSIVGYTNAGKSTLLNALTSSDVFVANQLFATLDTTSRQWWLSEGHAAVLTDTVGFIRHLPESLMKAFRATLEELDRADVLLHVVDASDERASHKIQMVDEVLKDLGLAEIPCVLVWNKSDQVSSVRAAGLLNTYQGSVLVSSIEKTGFNLLKGRIQEILAISEKPQGLA
jgi:GTP-binding protein HflX